MHQNVVNNANDSDSMMFESSLVSMAGCQSDKPRKFESQSSLLKILSGN